MSQVAIWVNISAVILLFVLFVYVATKSPSKIQILLLLLLISSILTLLGYVMEISVPKTWDEEQIKTVAMIAIKVSYIGKPFALLTSLLFIAEYCGRYPRKWMVILLSSIAFAFTVIVLSNDIHGLYYPLDSIKVNKEQIFSPMSLGHGFLYYLYAIYMVGTALWTIILVIGEYKKCKTKHSKEQVAILLAMTLSIVVGYMLFLTGTTYGYDTTLLGLLISVILLSILFFKYNLFDYLLYAKSKALDEASEGILVLNARDEVLYKNSTISKLFDGKIFSIKELIELGDGINNVVKKEKVFKVNKSVVENDSVLFGKTIEVSDITSQHNYLEALSTEVENKTRKIKDIQEEIIISFAELVEARDKSTGDHVKRISKYTRLIAEQLAKKGKYSRILSKEEEDNILLKDYITTKDKYSNILTKEYISTLVRVSPLHDVGKIYISDLVLCKPGKLTDEEFDIIKTHTIKGGEIIDSCFTGLESEEYVSMAKDVAMYHHEKWNGLGYPQGLEGEEIPLSARIVAVADVYDAIRSKRCYKEAVSKEEARAIIKEGSGTQFDPDVVNAFFEVIDKIEKLTK